MPTNWGELAQTFKQPGGQILSPPMAPADTSSASSSGGGLGGLIKGLSSLVSGGSTSSGISNGVNPQQVQNAIGMNPNGNMNTTQPRINQLVQQQISPNESQGTMPVGTQLDKSLLSTPAFQTAYQAHSAAMQNGLTKSPLVTVVDYSRPATTPRMWVVDTTNNTVKLNTYVAQGATPGFSNTPNSHQSSLGTYLTGDPYHSDSMNKDAMKLQGLDKGVNDNAFARGIVVHGGSYVGPDKNGTSWGCFAVPNSVAPTLIGLTKEGTIVHAYAPDHQSVGNFSNNLVSKEGKQALSQTTNTQNLNSTAQTIAKFEGYQSNPSWDVNAFRAGYGSDTMTKADGSIVKVRPGMQVSQEDAQRDLQRRTQEFQTHTMNQVGVDNWNKLPPSAQTALTSVAYNYGSLPHNVAQAVQSGDLNQIANSIASHAGDNKGINRNRRMEESKMVFGIQQSNSQTALGGSEGSPIQLPTGYKPGQVQSSTAPGQQAYLDSNGKAIPNIPLFNPGQNPARNLSPKEIETLMKIQGRAENNKGINWNLLSKNNH